MPNALLVGLSRAAPEIAAAVILYFPFAFAPPPYLLSLHSLPPDLSMKSVSHTRTICDTLSLCPPSANLHFDLHVCLGHNSIYVKPSSAACDAVFATAKVPACLRLSQLSKPGKYPVCCFEFLPDFSADPTSAHSQLLLLPMFTQWDVLMSHDSIVCRLKHRRRDSRKEKHFDARDNVQ